MLREVELHQPQRKFRRKNETVEPRERRFTPKARKRSAADDDRQKQNIQHFPINDHHLGAKVIDIGVLPVFAIDRLHDQEQKRERAQVKNNAQPVNGREKCGY